MLAELTAANAAFQIIKTTISNGRELASCGKALGTFISCKEELMREGNKKRARGVGGNDLEEFMALEKIKTIENELISMMRLYGRPGLYDDWVRFQAEARKKRRQEALEIKARKARNMEYLGWAIAITMIVGGFVGLMFWVKWLAA